jgi:hypothetical protein
MQNDGPDKRYEPSQGVGRVPESPVPLAHKFPDGVSSSGRSYGPV